MITGHRRHAQGGSSHQHASVAALQTGPYGGIDQLTQSNIGAAFRPAVFQANAATTTVTSATFVEAGAIIASSGKRPTPMYIWAFITTPVATTGEAKVVVTLDDASTIETVTASVAGANQTLFLSWGMSTFAAAGEAWNAVVSGDNLFTRLDTALNGRYITRFAVHARRTAGAGSVDARIQVGGFYI